MDVDIFEEEVEDFIGEGGGNLKRTLHFWEKKILTKKHLKTKKVSKEERLNIPCSVFLRGSQFSGASELKEGLVFKCKFI